MQVLILGATGRLGQMVQWAWANSPGFAPLWQARQTPRGPQATTGAWVLGDPLAPGADLKAACRRADGIINLLGVTPGAGADLDLNTPLALAPFQMGAGARVITASSASVYGLPVGPCIEGGVTRPLHPYGQAKLAMEQAVQAQTRASLIARIGNIAGADQLLGGLSPDRDPVLHVFEDGATPLRAYISPKGLADALAAVIKTPTLWPGLVNVAAPAPVAMGDLLDAAGRAWTPAPAPDSLPREVIFDTTRLGVFIPPADLASTARAIVADWQVWRDETGGFV